LGLAHGSRWDRLIHVSGTARADTRAVPTYQEPTRVMLVDMSRMLREVVGAVLALEPDMDVVGEVAGGASLVTAVGRHRADVVVLGTDHLPVSDACLALLDECPAVVVLALTDEGRSAAVCRLIGEVAADGLVQAIRCARAVA
jgi:two-component system, NarL family, response regulator DesR